MPERAPQEDVLETLNEVWADFPELRLIQLIVNAVAPIKPDCIFNIEDNQLIESLKNSRMSMALVNRYNKLLLISRMLVWIDQI